MLTPCAPVCWKICVAATSKPWPAADNAGLPAPETLLREVQAEHPTVRQLGLSRLVQPAADSLRADTTLVVAVRTARPLPAAEAQHLTHWLEVR